MKARNQSELPWAQGEVLPPDIWMRLRALRSPDGRSIDFECVDGSPRRGSSGLLRLLPQPGRRLLDEAPWVCECSLFDACVRVVERQVPHMERVSRMTAAGVTWMQARMAP